MTGITWHVVRRGYPVANLVLRNSFAHCSDFTCNLMSKYKRRLMNTVPLHDITAADTARHDLHKYFTGADLRYRHLFNPNVPVIVVHCHAHRWQNISICLKKNLWWCQRFCNASVSGVWFYYFILHKLLATDLRLQVFLDENLLSN